MSPHVKHLSLWKQKLLDGEEAWEERLGQLRAGERHVQEEGGPWQMRHPREKRGVADKGRQRPLSLAVRGFYGGFSPPAGEAMAPHSSTLAWKIPWTEEPGGLQSMGSLRVGHD